ncbi:MAG: DNA polymerase III subunit epsilon [Alphaproteobacteria bacterium]|nr:DNA polymerase III subunit epsilon [Alphaproteobacteria bacterium]
MREIVLDTETTGLDPNSGDRVIEIGCIELINHMPTGETYQQYINPERDMPAESFRIHGLSEAFLADYPVFPEIVDGFLDFIADDKLVIHNAAFDIKFLNAELERLGFTPLPMTRAIDTVQIARTRYPGASASLDDLCRRFGVDNTSRALHGALLDSDLLASVYIDLIGAREPGFDLSARDDATVVNIADRRERVARPARPHAPSAAELEAHETLVSRIDEPIWVKE